MSGRARVCARLWERARACALEAAHVYAGVRACAYGCMIIILYSYICGAVCAGVRTCMYLCEHSNVFMCTCVRVHYPKSL